MRRLLIIPIIHSQSDLGSLATAANASKTAALGMDRAAMTRQNIDQFWHELTNQLQAMRLDCRNLLVYQDGLPYVANAALQLERQIVEELARNGSPNHKLVKWLMDQGAGLVGTESTELLLKEYAAIRQSIANGFRDAETRSADEIDKPSTAAADNPGTPASEPGREATEPSLLEQRDRFIANRISQTLGEEQCGILFIGMLHRVEQFLPQDVFAEYPVGKPSGQPRAHAAVIIDR